MIKFILQFQWFFIFELFSILAMDHPRVTLRHGGVLVGQYQNTLQGVRVRSFLGIPYAQPPVGELRFKAPVPYGAWNGEKQADHYGNICPQKIYVVKGSETMGEEDCLFLNVFVPENITYEKQNLSVMVYIHGGAWVLGCSNHYTPDRLLDHNLILVTINYRLGILGFLNTGTVECSGNNGLKDQVLALKWIQENIDSFGGNPNDVTVFGESAGSASINYLMYSPFVAGLFHKAILQSGTIYDAWAFLDQEIIQSNAYKVTKLLGCEVIDDVWKDAIECLRKVSYIDFIEIVPEFFDYEMDPLTSFPPSIELQHDGALLTENPRKVTTKIVASTVPVIIGVVRDEGVVRTAKLLHSPDEKFRDIFEQMLPIVLAYHHKPENVKKELSAAIDEFYFQGKHNWDITNHENLTNLVSDRWFLTGLDKFLRKRFNSPETNNSPTYVYLFDQNATIPVSKRLFGYPEYYGIGHGDEIEFLFNFNGPPAGDERIKSVETLMPLLWTNFAKTGDPTSENPNMIKWKPTMKYPIDYLHIGNKYTEGWSLMRNEVGFFEDRMNFWRNFESILNETT